MNFRVPPWAADVIVSALRIALRPEASPSSMRPSSRGPRSMTARQKSRMLARLASEQGITPIRDFGKLALDEPDEVPLEEFSSFIRAARRGGSASVSVITP
jgi:hypothetical protein